MIELVILVLLYPVASLSLYVVLRVITWVVQGVYERLAPH